ncbi:MAG: hypothetical protein AVDCRST_MAG68-2734, partial [uncultured Gemmatimonadetes bacterium]
GKREAAGVPVHSARPVPRAQRRRLTRHGGEPVPCNKSLQGRSRKQTETRGSKRTVKWARSARHEKV